LVRLGVQNAIHESEDCCEEIGKETLLSGLNQKYQVLAAVEGAHNCAPVLLTGALKARATQVRPDDYTLWLPQDSVEHLPEVPKHATEKSLGCCRLAPEPEDYQCKNPG
jgi:hypothetical protein